MKKFSEVEKIYKAKQLKWKTHIRLEANKFKRFWMWVWFLIAFPFVWLFYNCRDWRSLVCIVISFLLWSASVWIWYLLAVLTGWNTDTAKWFIGIGSAVWIWWASPVGSPFILLVTFTAIGMKALFNKMKEKRKTKCELQENAKKCPYKIENDLDPDYNPEYIPKDWRDKQ